MKQIYFLFSILFIQSLGLLAQVGINNQSPNATLDVNGDVLVQDKLYLENPGKYIQDPDSKLLMINDDTGEVIKYDVENSVFGPLNYVQFVFNNVSNFGLDGGYNTKIDATNYTLAVHGFYFNIDGNTNISFRSVDSNTYVEGHQFYAYVQGGVWWVKGLVNNSQFYTNNNLSAVDIYMDVIIYRNDFITKIWDTPQTIDMLESPTQTAPLPAGF